MSESQTGQGAALIYCLVQAYGTAAEAFKDMDLDHDGRLSKEELGEGLGRIGVRLSSQRLDAFLESMDIDGNKQIDYKEFLRGVSTVGFSPPLLCTIATGQQRHQVHRLPLCALPRRTQPFASASRPQGLAACVGEGRPTWDVLVAMTEGPGGLAILTGKVGR